MNEKSFQQKFDPCIFSFLHFSGFFFFAFAPDQFPTHKKWAILIWLVHWRCLHSTFYHISIFSLCFFNDKRNYVYKKNGESTIGTLSIHE
jgi:hypothetical protein